MKRKKTSIRKEILMINEIIDLLPSADLKAKIKETGYRFSEGNLLQIIYHYAPTFDQKLELLARFAETASPELAALANAYIEFEQDRYRAFTEQTEGFVYELLIKYRPDAYEEHYLCASYEAALVCIDRFYEEYADIDTKETEQSRYRILKRKVFFEENAFEEDEYGKCTLGAGKTVLDVYYKNESDCDLDIMCDECKEICPYRCDNVDFPCFVKDRALVRYPIYKGKEQFGVCLCLCSENGCNGLTNELYVIQLNSPSIREHRFEDYHYEHDHIALPLVSLATPEELDEFTRKNYFTFMEYLNSQQD